MELFELVLKTDSMFLSNQVVPKNVVDLHKLENTLATNAHIAALTKQVELLVKAQVKTVNAVNINQICENC